MSELKAVPEPQVEAVLRRIRCSRGLEPADLVLKGCNLVNVYLESVHPADIAILDGIIVAIRDGYEGQAAAYVDCAGLYALPGFVGIVESAAPSLDVHAPEMTSMIELGEFPLPGDWQREASRSMPKILRADSGSPRLQPRSIAGQQNDAVLVSLRNGNAVAISDGVLDHALEELLSQVTKQNLDTRNICVSASAGNLRTLALATEAGIPLMEAIQMLSLNAATIFGLESQVGSVTPGRMADIILMSQLNGLIPYSIYSGGVLIGN